MLRTSKERTAWSYRTLREAPSPIDANVDVTLFANYYGTLSKSQRFNDPQLYTDKKWYRRLIDEIKVIRLFRRNKKRDNCFGYRRNEKHA